MTKLNVEIRNGTLSELLQAIEHQSEFTFVYNAEEIDLNEKVSAQYKNKTINEILTTLLKKQELDFAITDRHIVLYKKDGSQQQAKRKVTGVVTDETGEPVIGANIMVKGSLTGVITNIDGEFSIEAANSDALQITYIGFIPLEVSIGTNASLNIILREDLQSLDEVIVVGYGTQKKVNLTGAVATVDDKILKDRPINSITSGLQGAVAGLYVTPKNGNPNESTKFNIRGTTSINGGDPLVLVDGVEMDINLVNPNDIANVTVLKDAASAAIYGVRGAYGVVLITTKNATSEKTTVSYSGSFSLSTPTVKYEFVDNSVDHMEFMNYAMTNAGLAPVYNQDHINKVKAYRRDPNNNPEWEILSGEYYY